MLVAVLNHCPAKQYSEVSDWQSVHIVYVAEILDTYTQLFPRWCLPGIDKVPTGLLTSDRHVLHANHMASTCRQKLHQRRAVNPSVVEFRRQMIRLTRSRSKQAARGQHWHSKIRMVIVGYSVKVGVLAKAEVKGCYKGQCAYTARRR
jgi:hypothetical protein